MAGVNGGLYREMFPGREANPDGNGKIQLETSGADAPGRTSTEKIPAEVSEWMEPGISGNVVPGAVSADLESPGMLRGLMALKKNRDLPRKTQEERIVRRIIICLDGTWASPGKKVERGDGTEVHKPSNVLKTFRAVVPRTEGGTNQISYYDEGVGAVSAQRGLHNSALAKLDSVLGGAWGAGFEQNIESAYTFIAGNFVPGDEIFVFGFSRGAGQARSLCRFIDWMGGILHKRDSYFIPDFFKEYIETEGAQGRAQAFLAELLATNKKIDPPMATKIRFLGVYDTVLALGSRLRADFDKKKGTTAPGLEFHVGENPPAIVSVARQALAIDERRTDFRPEIWRGAEPGQSVEQRWFPGVHTSIGGGYANDGLANGALRWMIDEAIKEKLVVDEKFLGFYRPWFGDERQKSLKGFMKVRNWMRGLKGESGDRDLLATADVAGLDVHESALKLLGYDDSYRPENLLAYMRARPDLAARIPPRD